MAWHSMTLEAELTVKENFPKKKQTNEDPPGFMICPFLVCMLVKL